MLSFCCWVKCLYYYYTTNRLNVKSLWRFFKISRNAAFVDRSFRSTLILYHRSALLQVALAIFFNFFSLTLASCLHSTTCVVKKKLWARIQPCLYRYTRARVRWRGGGRARWSITTHDTFISSNAKNAQYSTTLPYVKSRQIAKNRLVFPNCTLIANRRSRKV